MNPRCLMRPASSLRGRLWDSSALAGSMHPNVIVSSLWNVAPAKVDPLGKVVPAGKVVPSANVASWRTVHWRRSFSSSDDLMFTLIDMFLRESASAIVSAALLVHRRIPSAERGGSSTRRTPP
eukprot:CAMPEP_0180314688 /NCGR_PEP_ID=MMETSP0988-20121125/32203_1 /TAXON_ID=697907 /ORGANISM="non described non described, Strain CCMP2293" /LENGTH=122 /DNA_ID=CAMNT_0022299425 /DNA_START=593 /DNA_END=957 /DNA_ORIENTATION=+